MSNIWNQTIHINKELATKLINSQMNIEVDKIELIGESFDNIAYLINETIVFRFPRREVSIELLKTEIELLLIIAKNVSFAISCPKFFGKSTETYPYPFIGYPIIKGVALSDFTDPPVTSKKFATELAKALKQLHSIPVKTEHQNKYPDIWRLDVQKRTERLNECLNKYESVYQKCGFDRNLLANIIAKFAQLRFSSYQKCYVHGDLYSKHIIVDGIGNLSGLIDWGDIHIGHPSIDIAGAIMILDDDSLAEFSKIYGKFDLEVAVFRSICHSMITLPYADEQKDKKFLKWSKFALARSIQLFI